VAVCRLARLSQVSFERRNTLTKQMEFLGKTVQEGQNEASRLYGAGETDLALAKHAENWEWREAQSSAT